MLKKESDTPSRVNLGIRCSACVGFKRESIFEKPCVKLGIVAKDFACPSFKPDVQRLTRVDLSALKVLARLTKSMRREELQILAFTFRNMDFLHKIGMFFGQRVYFSMGKDYISEFVHGRVVGASANGEYVYISSNLGKGTNNASLTLLRDSVMSVEEFAEHRKQLAKTNKLRPAKDNYRHKPSVMDVLRMSRQEFKEYMHKLTTKPTDYEPPSMDTVPRSWLDKRQKADIGNILDSRRKKGAKKHKYIKVEKDGTVTLQRRGNLSSLEEKRKKRNKPIRSFKPFKKAA